MAQTILLNFLIAALVFMLISRKLLSFIKSRYCGQGVKYKANVIFCGIIAFSAVPVVFLTFNEFLMLTAVVLIAYFFRKNLFVFSQKTLSKKNGKIKLAAVAAIALVCGLVGCQADTDTEQIDIEQNLQASQQTVATTTIEQVIDKSETTEKITSNSRIEPETEKNNSNDGVFTIDSDVYPLDSEEITIRVDMSMDIYGDFKYRCIDLENLKNYSNLKRLNISAYDDNEVGIPIKLINCESITELNGLEEITLNIVEFDGTWLSEVNSLKKLDIYWCELNWDFLHDLSQVETLILCRCDITELDFINDMKSLSELFLTNIGIEKFEIAEENHSLKRLMLSENAFTDISGIVKLCNLEYLYVSETNDFEYQMKELKKNLPTCEINLIKESN